MSDYFELKEKGLRKVLTHNSVKCLECGEVLVSKSQHHYVQCSCPNETACDGGLDYQRVLAKDLDNVEVLSKYLYMTKDEYEDILEAKKYRQEVALDNLLDVVLNYYFIGGKK